MVADVDVFMVAEVPTNWYKYLFPLVQPKWHTDIAFKNVP